MQNTLDPSRADIAIPGLYNPSTDKGKEKLTEHDISTLDAHAANARWVDRGFDTYASRVQILSTPFPEPSKPILEGFNPAPIGIGTMLEGFDSAQVGNPPLEGFDRYNGPDMSILTREEMNIELKFKEGMDIRDFSRKVKALQDLAERGKLSKASAPIVRDRRVTDAYRNSLIERAYKMHGHDLEKFASLKARIERMDVDHIQELQLNGSDAASNLGMLDRSVNRSFGSQINHQLKRAKPGEKITKVTIKES
jgi:hypothetical protein